MAAIRADGVGRPRPAPPRRSRRRSVPRSSRSRTEFPATIDMEINMTYAIIGTGPVGATLARFFAAKTIPVLIANSRGPETLGEPGASVKAVTVDEAVEADIILVSVGSLAFKDIGAL